MPEREGQRDGRLAQAERLRGLDPERRPELVRTKPLRDQRLVIELLERVLLELAAELLDPTDLERADDDVPPPPDLGVEERIADRDRHLVAQLGRAHRVADDQDVAHRPRS